MDVILTLLFLGLTVVVVGLREGVWKIESVFCQPVRNTTSGGHIQMLENDTRTRMSKYRRMQYPDLFVVVVAWRIELQRLERGALTKGFEVFDS